MISEDKAFPLKDLIVMTSSGTVDLAASKAALKSLAEDPRFQRGYEVLLDWRDIECSMTVADVYEIAVYLSDPRTELPTHRKIAILVAGRHAFDHAKFLEVCANNRGVALFAFEDYAKANAWLEATLPRDPKEEPTATPGTGGSGRAAMAARIRSEFNYSATLRRDTSGADHVEFFVPAGTAIEQDIALAKLITSWANRQDGTQSGARK